MDWPRTVPYFLGMGSRGSYHIPEGKKPLGLGKEVQFCFLMWRELGVGGFAIRFPVTGSGAGGFRGSILPQACQMEESPPHPSYLPFYLPFNLSGSVLLRPSLQPSPPSDPEVQAPSPIRDPKLQALMSTALSWTQAPGPPSLPPSRLPVLGLPALAGL